MQNVVRDYEIQYLVHFTRLYNLTRILSEGLKSRNSLEQEGGGFLFSDTSRIDGHTDAICLSISFPNYKMFYSLRCNNLNDRWVVLFLKPDLLWEKDCAFFKTNAASNNCMCLNIENRKTRDAFYELFDEQTKEIPNEVGEMVPVGVRSYFRLPQYYPTDPQAEVLCFESIETEYIIKICFQSIEDRQSISIPNRFCCSVDQQPFRYRMDYSAWR